MHGDVESFPRAHPKHRERLQGAQTEVSAAKGVSVTKRLRPFLASFVVALSASELQIRSMTSFQIRSALIAFPQAITRNL